MMLPHVLKELNLNESAEIFMPYWEEDMASLPEEIELLQPHVFLPIRDFVCLEAALDPLLEETAAEIRQHEALRRLFWHCYNLLFSHIDYPAAQIRQWPPLPHLLGEHHGLFYLLIAFGAVPLAKQKHQARGIPAEITRGIYGNLEECVRMFQALYPGQWGADVRVLYWLRNASEGRLYRLGRMEYMNKPFVGRLRAFRHRLTGEIVALSEAGVTYTEEGFVGEEGWTATLEIDAPFVRGYLIHPAGYALRDFVELSLTEWECVLQPGDFVLEMHIPGGGGFLPERCRDSMQQAIEFFPRYFPEQPFVGLACYSWILNPQWHEIYRPENNITAWQRELYLFPIRSSGRDGLFFLFGREDINPATAPRDTSMRRAVLDWLTAGKPLRAGGGFMLTEHVACYGSQFYRRQKRFSRLSQQL